MFVEILQAIADEPFVKNLIGNYYTQKPNADLETMMNDLGLRGEEREKFRKAYKDYQQNPTETTEKYKYKYEPKSDNPMDKFDAYFKKFEDKANEHEEKYGKGTGDYSHRKYAKYANGGGNDSQNQKNWDDAFNNVKSKVNVEEETKHFQALEISATNDYDTIKAAYKTVMKKYHPDKFSNPDQKKHAEALSMKINVAYDYFKKKFNK